MGKKLNEVDAYISKSAEFAKPVLKHFRELVHKTCPDVQEKMKWSFPHFDYKDEMMCSMASFKGHCAVNFWKAALMKDFSDVFNPDGKTAMGHFGRIEKRSDLPSDKILTAIIKEAMRLNDEKIRIKPVKAKMPKELIVPDFFKKQISKNKKAADVFEKFSPSHKREYIDWITEAKTDETKLKRMIQAVEWMSEGKSRNWKYIK